jgi:hypothetical protein
VSRVVVFGAGIAGLAVAHELVRRGHDVVVYERNGKAGGFFRSARVPRDRHMPSEYSWHGFGGWYHNAYAVLRQIPFDGATVYDRSLSRPIDFGLAPDEGEAAFDDGSVVNVRALFRMTRWDVARWAWLMLRTWTAGRRSVERYAAVSAAEAWRPLLSDQGWRTWRASFGPWVGSDWTKVSLHQVGLFFRKHLMLRPPHVHPADEEGPAWVQRSRTGWLLLRGPSNEVWLDPWVEHLERSGVRFAWHSSVEELRWDGRRVTGAVLDDGVEVEADLFVLAIDPFSTADLLDRTPDLAALDQLRSFRPLVQDGPHVQISFRIAFGERILWPRERTAVVIADSEFDLTLFAEEQVWREDEDLGDGVQSLWTGTACVASEPGRLYGLPLARCTKEQFLAEVRAQLDRCGGLDALIREANGGRSWTSFPIVRIEVWHEWVFSPEGISGRQPKWVNTTHTQPHLPTQHTPVPNLFLAGAHTRTTADVWSIEAAVESGRRAAREIEPDVEVIPEFVPLPIRALRAFDDLAYAAGAPHVLDLLLVAVPLAAFAWWLRRRSRSSGEAYGRLKENPWPDRSRT